MPTKKRTPPTPAPAPFSFKAIERDECNALLSEWGYRPCKRPLYHQSFALLKGHQIVAVAHSAALARRTYQSFDWTRTVELARIGAHPDHQDMIGVMLRLYRTVAREEWDREYVWDRSKPTTHILSYSRDAHFGQHFRFDGWGRVVDKPPSSVWCWPPASPPPLRSTF